MDDGNIIKYTLYPPNNNHNNHRNAAIDYRSNDSTINVIPPSTADYIQTSASYLYSLSDDNEESNSIVKNTDNFILTRFDN